MIVLGIDPGKDGAIVGLFADDGELAIATLTQTCIVGKHYAPAEMVAAIREVQEIGPIRLAVLETVSCRPGEGRSSILSMGIGWGLWRGILAALDIPTTTPTAGVWTRAILRDAPGQGKDRAIHVAGARIPNLNLTPGKRSKPHSGLADAGCLALYGLTEKT